MSVQYVAMRRLNWDSYIVRYVVNRWNGVIRKIKISRGDPAERVGLRRIGPGD